MILMLKFCSGYIIIFAGCPLIWTSTLQTEIALCSTDMERIALCTAAREILSLMTIFKGSKEQCMHNRWC